MVFLLISSLSSIKCLSGQLEYRERNTIEKWFHTLSMRIDRFHAF